MFIVIMYCYSVVCCFIVCVFQMVGDVNFLCVVYMYMSMCFVFDLVFMYCGYMYL